ncbi:MAG: hypothetical protein S4CHLAM45_03090 [Chlamydiales bacterium]|nr:hypothetical protein [Chlamydiales bacterium]MCH9619167.1 hypothetical protein [Chlamydiales bacterium]MCH9622429.1 hypothetical protein [Chlamydiales bacterium]
MRLIFSFLLLMTPLFARVSISQPKGWDRIQDPNQLPAKIELIYVGSAQSKFRPSINVAKEEISVPLNDYVEAAKEYHSRAPQTLIQELGTIKTASGPGKLLQIDRKTEWGNVRFIQASIAIDKVAYVITGTCLKEEFGTYCTTFFDAIKTFKVEN